MSHLLRIFVFVVGLVLIAPLALAQERITNFDVQIDVARDGDMTITETIRVISEGDQIRRGIFRELPSKYTFMGVTQDYDYEFLSVTRDGRSDTMQASSQGNAVTWRIGRADVFLEDGPHVYELTYRVGDQIRHHDDRQEVYWNATGDFWDFPIESATATVNFPRGVEFVDTSAYTGRRGSAASEASIDASGNSVRFATTSPLDRREGLTVSVSVAPGVLAPMSEERRAELDWIRRGGPTVLGVGALGLLAYYLMMWFRLGRDPQKPPVFARYAPPKGYSPAAVHVVHHRGIKNDDWFTALLTQLGAQDHVHIEATKKTTTIRRRRPGPDTGDARKLLDDIVGGVGKTLKLDGKTNNTFHKAFKKYQLYLMKNYGKAYYQRNLGWAILGLIGSAALIILVLNMDVARGWPVTVLIVAIVALNLLFMKLLGAPTPKGANVSSEIEGFKLYLETAEADRINTANPLGERPPMMSVELYERFLPYAIALGVEKPWTKQFERTLPKEAAEYQPGYVSGSSFKGGGKPLDFTKALATGLTAGVAAAAPVSQSSSSGGFSSGSSGGGFSGGGGGGGGGGGW